jgi:hypothetical protein
MRKPTVALLALTLLCSGLQAGIARAVDTNVHLREFTIDKDVMCDITKEWTDELIARHPDGGWVKMKMELSDAQLARIGLPSHDVLASHSYAKPTLVTKSGETFDVPVSTIEDAMAGSSGLPNAATFAGTGCFGIRPGALLLIVTDSSISLCSMAHLYGSAISTAGHCGKSGDPATVIAGFGNRADATGVVLLDFGTFGTSVDNGLGNDYALININPAYSSLVTPTMCFWGGPRGVYTKTGAVASLDWPNNGDPSVSVTPDPFLAQTLVHYGHGAGVGAGGTPRVSQTISWGADHFMFFGAIAPGDSGSGANTLLGDTVGANMQAAGIITHLWIDPLMRDGIGIMGGTRATKVGTPTNGQIVPYPIPISGLP